MTASTRRPGTGWFLAVSLLVAWLSVLPGAARAGEPDTPDRDVRSLLDRYCLACHGDKKTRGGLDLAALSAETTADKDQPRWQKVWARVRARQMPPPDEPRPTAEDRDRLLAGIEAGFAKHTLDGR